ncbi:hypothetical protein ABY58_13150 [Edwardsiella ictaluri]|nr:SH3 domain-containing protein [Edwardsiella ictaluri]KMQ77713.1 hypothetical protein ABY58_13150 [Edwardsiella ictaluri]
MMKEKKTSLSSNENEFHITPPPSVMEEIKCQDSLFAGTVTSKALEALTRNSVASTFLKNHNSLLASNATSKVFEALTRNSVASTFLKNHDSLLASNATSKAFEALTRNSVASIFLKNHNSLLASDATSKAFEALTRNSGVTQQLEKLNLTEIQTLQEAAILFSRSPQGAAVIATNIHAVKEKEPDALTKLKNYIEESPITTSFRKLPLLLQIIIIYLTATISSVAVEKNKEIAMSLIEQAQQYVSKTVSPSSHVKKLTRQLPIKIDTSTLKYIRIITGENVRIRDKPSMQGDVLVTLEKYTPVIVIDQSDRKWLYVQLSFGDQKLYGWVNRSYTKAINH